MLAACTTFAAVMDVLCLHDNLHLLHGGRCVAPIEQVGLNGMKTVKSMHGNMTSHACMWNGV
eukprot:6436755-Amphidinium_carterae.1